MKLAVIIPVHNGGEAFRSCLEALTTATRLPDETIVVDDASTDTSVQIASSFGALVLSQGPAPLGPARARNRGAKVANSEILVFIDADVRVHPDTLALIDKYMEENHEVAALFGSYDDDPSDRSLVSLYKNLLHHFVHQNSNREASTFWSGAGAVRREVFFKLGGFNERYHRPSIEDIEFGVRLRMAGYRVLLCADVLVKHLKPWKLTSLLRTDILDRAVPWTRLILNTSQMPADLNLDLRSRLSAIAIWAFWLLLAFGFWQPILWTGSFLFLGLLIALNSNLYRFFAKKGGYWFALGAVGLHMFYFSYSSITFGVMTMWHLLTRANRHTDAALKLDGLIEETFHD